MSRILAYLFLITVLLSCKSNRFSSLYEADEKSYSEQEFNRLIESWKFKVITNDFEVVIIDYLPPLIRCGRVIENAMAIAKSPYGRIRIVDQCPSVTNYFEGEGLIFSPSFTIPEDRNPQLIYVGGSPNPNNFKYPKVKKTFFGFLERKQ